ncbi:MAG: prolyl oligopeptidase family serine peptidase [Candidatus Marinimicrobia bacterium]|nr:prolyl oligopeptidase family serine peptidase [Candidatus Neomarinimicrobiota bacterium]
MYKRLTAMSIMLLVLFSCGKKEVTPESVKIADPQVSQTVEVSDEKRAMTPDDYADWQRLSNPTFSKNGKWTHYTVQPNRGDVLLSLYEVESGKKVDFERAVKASFSPDNDFLVFKRVPLFEVKRKAKLDKVKKDKMPKDSLCVYLFSEDTLLIIPRVKSYDMSDEGSPWITLLHEKPLPPVKDTSTVKDTLTTDSLAVADTTVVDTSKKKVELVEEKKKEKKAKKKKVREDGTPFWVWNPVTQDTVIMKYVSSYTMSKDGKKVVTLTKLKTDSVRVSIIDACSGKVKTILETYGKAKSFSFDNEGKQLTFLFSDDTTDEKIYNIYYWKTGRAKAKCYLNEDAQGIKEGWGVSSIRMPKFSKDGKRLVFGTAPLPVEEPEDTLLKNEKAKFDLWSWTDPLLQTQQKKQLAREKKRNYQAMVNVGSKKVIQLADVDVPTIKMSNDKDENLVLGESNRPYRQLISWESIDYYDYYLVDVNTGKKELILEKKSFAPQLSPQEKYLLYYDHVDSNWYAMDVDTRRLLNLTEDLSVEFYDIDDDSPSAAGPYGFAAWGLDDHYAYIYDKYDIWKFDLSGEKVPLNVTNGAGRKAKDIYRYVKLNADLDYIPISPIILAVFNEKSKKDGYATVNMYKGGEPEKLVYSDHQYSKLKKAKCSDIVMWRKGTYREYPDLYISDLKFEKSVKVSAMNPQQSQFRWASVELVEWKNSDGVELQGMLYTPDDLDKTKKHPMIIYYYEKYSDYLHQYFMPGPSYSTVNKTMYPSNGYILFIPDIVYKKGHPGKSGLDCVMTGVDMLLGNYNYINKDKIGIQGQSWGGYQTAYFVTQTNRFAAAMAGASVSNMTSAYGGIRWYSGLSRMMQYEGGQSRIGGTLWDSFDLYIENSPIFFADRIETPLLMMHNDNDGAVPWTQSIEMMVAMRRLQKPAWMLVYNDDTHNLTRANWGNRMDLTIRMKQFFDHYLMDKPLPRWMNEGISAMEKGKEMKYDLIEEK